MCSKVNFFIRQITSLFMIAVSSDTLAGNSEESL